MNIPDGQIDGRMYVCVYMPVGVCCVFEDSKLSFHEHGVVLMCCVCVCVYVCMCMYGVFENSKLSFHKH